MVAKDFQGSTTVTLPSSPENGGEFAVTIMDLLKNVASFQGDSRPQTRMNNFLGDSHRQ